MHRFNERLFINNIIDSDEKGKDENITWKIALIHDEGTVGVGDKTLIRQIRKFGEFDKLEVWRNSSEYGNNKDINSKGHLENVLENINKAGYRDNIVCKETQTGALYVRRDASSFAFVKGKKNDDMQSTDRGLMVELTKGTTSIPDHDLRHSANMVMRCFENGVKDFDLQYDEDHWIERDSGVIDQYFTNQNLVMAGMSSSYENNMKNYKKALGKLSGRTNLLCLQKQPALAILLSMNMEWFIYDTNSHL